MLFRQAKTLTADPLYALKRSVVLTVTAVNAVTASTISAVRTVEYFRRLHIRELRTAGLCVRAAFETRMRFLSFECAHYAGTSATVSARR